MAMQACVTCGWAGSPRRLWCPRCGADRWQPCEALPGTVAAVTQVHGSGAAAVSHVALIALDGADFVIARCHGELASGARVRVVPGANCLEAVASG